MLQYMDDSTPQLQQFSMPRTPNLTYRAPERRRGLASLSASFVIMARGIYAKYAIDEAFYLSSTSEIHKLVSTYLIMSKIRVEQYSKFVDEVLLVRDKVGYCVDKSSLMFSTLMEGLENRSTPQDGCLIFVRISPPSPYQWRHIGMLIDLREKVITYHHR